MKEIENDREDAWEDEGRQREPEGEWLGEEESLALKRLTGQSRVLEWLLAFAQVDLKNLSPGQWTDLSPELAVFSKYGPVVARPPLIAGWIGSQSIPRPSLKEAAAWQGLLRAPLNSLLNEGLAKFPSVHVTGYIYYLESADKVASWIHAKSREQSFIYHAFRALEGEARRIKRCEQCQRIFLTNRRTQRFCSIKCQGRTMHRRFVDRHRKTKK